MIIEISLILFLWLFLSIFSIWYYEKIMGDNFISTMLAHILCPLLSIFTTWMCALNNSKKDFRVFK